MEERSSGKVAVSADDIPIIWPTSTIRALKVIVISTMLIVTGWLFFSAPTFQISAEPERIGKCPALSGDIRPGRQTGALVASNSSHGANVNAIFEEHGGDDEEYPEIRQQIRDDAEAVATRACDNLRETRQTTFLFSALVTATIIVIATRRTASRSSVTVAN